MAKAKKDAEKKATKKNPAKKNPAKKTPTKKAAAPRAKKEGIGFFVEGMLKQKKDTDAILAAVKKKFPKAKTSPASLAWYRNKMREEGTLPKA